MATLKTSRKHKILEDVIVKPAAFWAIPGILPIADFHLMKRFSAKSSIGNLEERSNVVTPLNMRNFPSKSDGQRREYPSSISMHQLTRTFVFTGQLFGLLPVVGILGSSPNYLKFRWFSWRLLYSVISAMASMVITALCVYRIYIIGFTFQKTSSMAFYMITSLTTGAFLRLAIRWPKLVRGVGRFEVPSVDQSRNRRLLKTCRTIEFWVLLLAGVEHILSMLAGFSMAKQCSPQLSYDAAFFQQTWPQVFNITQYRIWKGIVCEVINFQSTFNWNFMDIFLIIISCYLTDRLQEIHDRLSIVLDESPPVSFWATIRSDFCNLVETVKSIDSAISEIVLVSFANNLYFIWLQLYNTLKPIRGLINLSYFVFSFIFLVGRTLAVSLYASKVNTTSKELIHQLNSIPSAMYCTEVRRFMQQVRYDNIAITGMGLFNITRGLILTVAGTILTYELVLLQFNNSSQTEIAFDECNYQTIAA